MGDRLVRPYLFFAVLLDPLIQVSPTMMKNEYGRLFLLNMNMADLQ